MRGGGAPLLDAPPQVALAAWLAALEGLAALGPTAVQRVPVGEALGRVAAADLVAAAPSPPAPCAAMDGFAVRASDTAGAGPGAEVLLAPGAFLPIDTGQPLGPPHDAVVPLERAFAGAAGVVVRAAVDPGQHVRGAGESVRAGQAIVARGRRLGPYDLALAAACGHAEVPVRRPPVVAILPTGDEVRPPGARLGPGEVADSNSVMLAALAREAGAAPRVSAICPDDPVALAGVVAGATAAGELVLVLSGASRGRRDHTADVLAGLGAVVVRGVAQRPGGPVVLAVAEGTPVAGLPGYPVAAARAFERFALPVIARLLGAEAPGPRRVRAELAEAVSARDDAHVTVPVRLQWRDGRPPLAWPGDRRAGALADLARADACLQLEPGAPRHAGATGYVTLTRSGG